MNCVRGLLEACGCCLIFDVGWNGVLGCFRLVFICLLLASCVLV